MAVITLTIPDAQLPRVVDGICAYYSYPATVLSGGSIIPNPETKNQFAKRMLVEQTEIWVATIEAETAKKNTYNNTLTELTIT